MLVKTINSIYRNPSNGFSIMVYEVIKNNENEDYCSVNDDITAKGYDLPEKSGCYYEVTGRWIKDRKYGMQYCVDTFKEVVPLNEDGIVNFLTATINGIGKVMAQRIFDKFGANSLKIIENDSQQLSCIKGISKEKCNEIHECYTKNKEMSNVYTFLSPFGVSPAYTRKIYSQFKENTISTIKNNPYAIMDVPGISFELADKISKAAGFPQTHPERIKACIKYVVKKNELSGNLYLHKREMLDQVLTLLKNSTIKPDDVANAAISLIHENKIVMAYDHIAISSTYSAETEIARKFISLTGRNHDKVIDDIDREIKISEEKLKITLSDDQRKAVSSAFRYNLIIITGGPGTGKTTIIKFIADIFYRNYKNDDICFIAPTGRASSRITESSGYSASTVHSRLELNGEENFSNVIIDEKMTIVDEFSMADIWLTRALFSAIYPGNTLIIIGDPEQLPSVGPGNVLGDLIASTYAVVVNLNSIYRQLETNSIYVNSLKIRKKECELTYDVNFRILESYDFSSSAYLMKKSYMEAISKYGIDNVCCLTPFRKKTETSSEHLNGELQNLVNNSKSQIKYGDTVIKLNDRVMFLKNTSDYSNGDIGIVTMINQKEQSLTIQLNSKSVTLTTDELNRIELAYTMTIHKSQGSEYDCVIINLLEQHGRMLNRNMIYTAITRAKKQVIIVGNENVVKKAIRTDINAKRKTLLTEKIIYLMNTQK